jgi:hypothetical protein
VDEYELRPNGSKVELTGGKLDESMTFDHQEYATRLVGFLSQRDGSVLRIFNAAGALVDTQRRDGSGVVPGAIGGLGGPNHTPAT